MSNNEMTLLELAASKGWDDARLVKFMVDELDYDEGDAWLYIEMERGESKGDVIEGGE